MAEVAARERRCDEARGSAAGAGAGGPFDGVDSSDVGEGMLEGEGR